MIINGFRRNFFYKQRYGYLFSLIRAGEARIGTRIFFFRQVSRDGDAIEFHTVPAVVPARGLNLIPIPVRIHVGEGDFSPICGGALVRTGIPCPTAIPSYFLREVCRTFYMGE